MHFISFDVETTGFDAHQNDIIELGAVKFNEKGEILDSFNRLINVNYNIPEKITELTGITDEELAGEDSSAEEVLMLFSMFMQPDDGEENVLIAHNYLFDGAFLVCAFEKYGIAFPDLQIWDSLTIARYCAGQIKNHKLGTLAEHIGKGSDSYHRAYGDSLCVKDIIMHYAEKRGWDNIKGNAKPLPLSGCERKIIKQKPLKFIPLTQGKPFFYEGNLIEKYEPLYFYEKSKEPAFLARVNHKPMAFKCEKITLK